MCINEKKEELEVKKRMKVNLLNELSVNLINMNHFPISVVCIKSRNFHIQKS